MQYERTHLKIEQGSEEWLSLRAGRFTSSNIKELLMDPNTKGYQDAIKRVAFEIITGNRVDDGFKSEWMTRGNELEAEARMNYEATTFNVVTPGGFFLYGDHQGSSPDGLISEDALLEIKCPKYNTMVDYLIDKEVPKIYIPQIQHQLSCTGRDWCDFMAYHPGIRPLIIRVERDEVMIENINMAVEAAIVRVNDLITKIQ